MNGTWCTTIFGSKLIRQVPESFVSDAWKIAFGRRLMPRDFTNCPLNNSRSGSEQLVSRLTGRCEDEPLEPSPRNGIEGKSHRNRFLKRGINLCLCHAPSVDHCPDNQGFAFRASVAYSPPIRLFRSRMWRPLATRIRNTKFSDSRAAPASINARRFTGLRSSVL